jgi:hypothetical protein
MGVNKSETLRFTQSDRGGRQFRVTERTARSFGKLRLRMTPHLSVILTSMLFARKNLHQSKGLKDPLRTTPKNDKRQRRDPSAIVLACGKEKPVLISFQGLISFTQLFSLKFKGVPKE